MADREKAIRILEQNYSNGVFRSKDELMPVTDIIALLKVQESVRPIIEKNISTGECEDPWGRLFFCGACGKRINEKYNPDEDDKYCKHCGQAVKWE